VSTLNLSEAGDRALMKGLAQRDCDAFVRLFDRYASPAMTLAQTILRHRHLAEEAVQEAFLAVWRHPDRYRAERGTVRSWLLSTVHHRAVDLVRREESQRRRAAEEDDTGKAPADPGDLVVEEIALADQRTAVRRALEDLPVAQRQIVELMYFGALSQTQISERLSMPLGTVKSRALLGMRRLRTALGELER
jgi:RNA polymerase sigma-70 factor (ECF subfamily)